MRMSLLLFYNSQFMLSIQITFLITYTYVLTHFILLNNAQIKFAIHIIYLNKSLIILSNAFSFYWWQ